MKKPTIRVTLDSFRAPSPALDDAEDLGVLEPPTVRGNNLC